ncbi:Panacea domain-containing protein [Ferruginibacter profundus]
MYNPNQIADYFLSKIDGEKGDTISPLKLQKLVYYAQAWHYTIFDTPLFDEKIEAWVNGPVVPSLYKRFVATHTKHSIIDVENMALSVPEFEPNTKVLLDEIYRIYGERSASYLENLTHSEQPWIKARGILPPFASCKDEITLASMKEYYSPLRNAAKA